MIRERISRDEMFINICQVVAQRSTCLRSQVGAVIVKDNRVVSMGYNGPVAGMPACEEILPLLKYDMDHGHLSPEKVEEIRSKECMGPNCTRSCHAETNAIAFAARAGVSVEGCTMYCTMSPCINCAKVIVNSGIEEVKYLHPYRNPSGIDFLIRSGVMTKKVELSGDDKK